MELDKTFNIDTVLYYAGDFNKHQYIILTLFSILNVLSAFHYFGQTFISISVKDECSKPFLNSTSFNASEVGDTELITNKSKVFEYEELLENIWEPLDNCTNYNYTSIVEELQWTGTQDWIPPLGQSLFFAGSVIGSLAFGVLADHIGRLHVVVFANLLAFVGNFMTIFSTEGVLFVFSRFIAGLATDTNFVMMYIIVMEYVRPSMRTLGLNLCIGVFYTFGCVVVPWVAIFSGSWKRLLLVISVPHLIVLTFYCLVPESAQWLISHGKTEEAIKCFKRIASMNNKTIPESILNKLKDYCKDNMSNNHSASIIGLFKTPKLRRKFCILIFKSMVMTLCYDLLSRNVDGLDYSPFTLFSISSSTILPACILILILQDRIGRKILASGSLLFSGIITTAAGLILATFEHPSLTLSIILLVTARFGVNIAYNSGAQYAVELIPTQVRGQGVSTIHVVGYAASLFSSQILYMRHFWKPFPEVILGVLLISGAAVCLALPETLNKTLPITLKDGEEFGEDEKFWDFAFMKKSESKSSLGV